MTWQSRAERKTDRQVRALLGICTHCPKPARPGRLTCLECAEKNARLFKRWLESQRERKAESA